MNHKSQSLKTSQAIEGFLQAKTAEGLSPVTLAGYQTVLSKWVKHQGDAEVKKINPSELRAYLNYLRQDYVPQRITGKTHPLSLKTIRNVYVILSSFFTWLNHEFQLPSPMKTIPAPQFHEAEVEPFSQSDITALLKAAEFCVEADTTGRRRFTMRRRTHLRDRALILMLLDTGLRASELCALNVGDLDPKTGKVLIKHGQQGGAKGGKGRLVYMGHATRKAVWRYLVSRPDGQQAEAPIFLANTHRMRRDALRQLMQSLGEKAQVQKCHPHRFRHTFAITYLRSGGDVFTLQRLLGHSTLEMVQHYARVAQVDLELAHRRASPADNWRL